MISPYRPPVGEAGVEGNERLTGAVAAVLFVLLAIEGVTIITLDQTMPWHVFIGVLLIPPALLKVVSTSYRMIRYYTGGAAYVERGVPATYLRLLGPVVVLATIGVLGSGVVLLAFGESARWARDLHQASFIVFLFSTAVHVLAHLRETPRLARADYRRAPRLKGAPARRFLVVVALLGGVAAGSIAVAYDGAWVHRQHRDRGGRNDG